MNRDAAEPFDLIVRSPIGIPEPNEYRYRTLAEMIESGEDRERPILIGPMGERCRVMTLGDFQAAAARTQSWCRRTGLRPGDTIVLFRLPRTSEIPPALGLFGFLIQGLHVVLPMGFDAESLPGLLSETGAKAALWVSAENDPFAKGREAEDAATILREQARDRGVSSYCLLGDLGLLEPSADVSLQAASGGSLILTTSGSTSRPKLVRYTSDALLRGAEAWHAAGLMEEETTGGPSLCPLFSHSMGVRNVFHALWNRRPTLLLYPEWLQEEPYRVMKLLAAHPPSHLTCGPALLHAIAQLFRAFPALGIHVARRLRCIVSSGAAYDERIREEFPGVRPAHAFGTTETQQVLNTLVGPRPSSPPCLGNPLPGVEAAVRFTDRSSSIGRLYIRSPFGAEGYLNAPDFGPWFDTGDLVRCEGQALTYVSRADSDFLKSGLGSKIPLQELHRLYGDLLPEIRAIDFVPLSDRGGIGAVAFVGEGDPEDGGLHSRIREAIEARHAASTDEGGNFVLKYSPLEAVACARGSSAIRGPGKADLAPYRRILDTPGHPARIAVSAPDLNETPYVKRVFPRLAALQRLLGLDWEFVSGEGNVLITKEGRRVLDLVGGFGAGLLGHAYPAVAQAAQEALRGVPLLDQGAWRPPAGALAEALAKRVQEKTGRDYVVCLASTGSEAVELALKHAALERSERLRRMREDLIEDFGSSHPAEVEACLEERRRLLEARPPLLIALEGSYHGKTVGALHVLSSEEQRRPFECLLAARTAFLSREGEGLGDLVDSETIPLPSLVRRGGRAERTVLPFLNILATIAEPVQGEGGMFEIPPNRLTALKIEGVPFILDEIQCGLGRSGRFLASEGIRGDYYLFSKSLGGGYAKIAAALIDRARYVESFDEFRGSTFAGDAFSCRVALRVLEVLEKEDVAGRAERVGTRLKRRLEELRSDFPRVIRDVRGRGAMLGVELTHPDDPPRAFFRALSDRALGYIASAYLLHRHGIRTLPTVSPPATIRIEPSAFFTDEEEDRLLRGLRGLCRALESSDVIELLGHWFGESFMESRRIVRLRAEGFRIRREEPAPTATRIAFVHHPIHPEEELLGDMPELRRLSMEQRLRFFDRAQQILEMKPMVTFARNLFGGRTWMAGILIPALPAVFEHFHRMRDYRLVRRRIQEALDLATGLGCRVVTFGGYTSILTKNATTLLPAQGVHVSSGNTFTVAVALRQIWTGARELGIAFGTKDRIGIVGAAGNIGSALVRALAREESAVVLVGRSGSGERLEEIRVGLDRGGVESATDMRILRTCNVIVLATNRSSPILYPDHVGTDRPVLIADISQPRACSPRVRRERPDAKVVTAGVVRLPVDPDFGMSPHLGAGVSFACAAEGILLGLEPRPKAHVGSVDLEEVEILAELAARYGLIGSGGACRMK